MNTKKLRQKRVIIPTIAAAAVIGVGGTVWTATANDTVQGNERDRVAAAAVRPPVVAPQSRWRPATI